MRERRRPAVLHLRCVRYLSHAGADAEMAYRSPQAIRADYERDPILGTARWLVSAGRASGEELANDYLAARDEAQALALEVAELPQMTSAEQVMAPLAPRSPGVVAEKASRVRLEGDDSAHARAGDQRRARRRARAPSERAPLRSGHRGQGRRVRRDARTARAVRSGPRLRHAARRDVDPRARAGRCRRAASCRYRRSSTSRTSTTPRTSCAARRRRCSSSRSARTGTEW